AAPMKIPSGEVVGVIEVLNKRRAVFNREDEEFLTAVAEHAAIAVDSSHQHQQAMEEAAERAKEEMLRALRPLLVPSEWPDTPGFDSAPLRWRATTASLLGFDAAVRGDALTLFIAEDVRPPEVGIADLVSTMTELRARLDGMA